MKDVWIVGATSHVAKALIAENLTAKEWKLTLVARSPEKVTTFLAALGYDLAVTVQDFTVLKDLPPGIEFVVNCVGFGTPAKQSVAGSDLFLVTEETDNQILRYLQQNASCGYINFSSGAVYGTAMEHPVAPGAMAELPLNPIQPKDWYRITKIHQEAKHRTMGDRWIVDIRLFSFFSRFIDLNAGFLMSDVTRALREGSELCLSAGEIYRDYIAPSDLYNLVSLVVKRPMTNCSIDTYSALPISKSELISSLVVLFGLKTRSVDAGIASPTGQKPYYYSQNAEAGRLFGYVPVLTSLDGIVGELHKMGLSSSPVQR